MDHIYQASFFAKNVNFPICQYLDTLPSLPFNNEKSAVSFLSGDPTIYGQKQFQMPQRGYEILKQYALDESNHGYSASSGLPAFRQAILKLYNPKFEVKTTDIQINHGVNMGLLSILMAMTNQGDQILVPEFGYPFYHNLCPSLNRKTITYKLKKDDNFNIDLEHLATLVTEKTVFIYIINPTNPMGTVFSRKHMEEILGFSDKFQIPLVCDEVYFKQVYPGVEAISFGQLVEDTPVIILSGVQKILSVPGWVQSWTILFDKHSILKSVKYNLEVLATIFLHTNVFCQKALVKILDEIGIFTSKNMGQIQENYKWLSSKIQNIFGLRYLPAQGTIYMSVQIQVQKFKDIPNDREFVRLLRLQQNVNVLPLSIMGEGVNGFRLLTCVGRELYELFLERIRAFIERHKHE